jgi:aspartate/methionine/tyrosine aminotransferase
MEKIPISPALIRELSEENGIPDPGSASIREIVQLVNLIERETGIRYVRMEMGVPGLPTPDICIEAEIEALRKGVSAIYPDITGLPELKKESHASLNSFLILISDPEDVFPQWAQ